MPAGLEDDAAPAGRFDRLEAHRDEEALYEREDDRTVARVLRDLAPPELPLLGELLQVRDHHREKLQDDARADVGHDAERKDREALEGTAGEEVHQPDDVVARLGEELGESLPVDARRGDRHPETVDGECPGREEEPLAELRDTRRICESFKHRLPPRSRRRRRSARAPAR